jgi:hypothetical protein
MILTLNESSFDESVFDEFLLNKHFLFPSKMLYLSKFLITKMVLRVDSSNEYSSNKYSSNFFDGRQFLMKIDYNITKQFMLSFPKHFTASKAKFSHFCNLITLLRGRLPKSSKKLFL